MMIPIKHTQTVKLFWNTCDLRGVMTALKLGMKGCRCAFLHMLYVHMHCVFVVCIRIVYVCYSYPPRPMPLFIHTSYVILHTQM